MALLLVVSSIGVVIYLNLKVGPSFERGFFRRTLRTRPGSGIISSTGRLSAGGSGRDLGRSICHTDSRHRFGLLVMVLPFAPGVLNWRAVDRRTDEVETRARLVEADMLERRRHRASSWHWETNDSYPLWYLQQVEGTRKDVTIVTLPLLGAEWYRAELARRYKLLDSATRREMVGARQHRRIPHQTILRSSSESDRIMTRRLYSISVRHSRRCSSSPIAQMRRTVGDRIMGPDSS